MAKLRHVWSLPTCLLSSAILPTKCFLIMTLSSTWSWRWGKLITYWDYKSVRNTQLYNTSSADVVDSEPTCNGWCIRIHTCNTSYHTVATHNQSTHRSRERWIHTWLCHLLPGVLQNMVKRKACKKNTGCVFKGVKHTPISAHLN